MNQSKKTSIHDNNYAPEVNNNNNDSCSKLSDGSLFTLAQFNGVTATVRNGCECFHRAHCCDAPRPQIQQSRHHVKPASYTSFVISVSRDTGI